MNDQLDEYLDKKFLLIPQEQENKILIKRNGLEKEINEKVKDYDSELLEQILNNLFENVFFNNLFNFRIKKSYLLFYLKNTNNINMMS